MKKIVLTFVVLIIANLTFGQVVKLGAGTSLSRLNWKLGSSSHTYFNDPIVGFSGSIGIDYFNKKKCNLSSSIGIIRKGGKASYTFASIPSGEQVDKAMLDYLTFNTTFDLKFPIKNKIIPYLSFGPRVDYIVKYTHEFEWLQGLEELKKVSYGLILGIGLKYNISKLQIGIKGDYLLNFNKIADWSDIPGLNIDGQIADETLLLNLTIGYVLR